MYLYTVMDRHTIYIVVDRQNVSIYSGGQTNCIYI